MAAKLIPGVNDLATLFPEIAKEWHPIKNGEGPSFCHAHSHKKVWWLCPNGHEYEMAVDHRTGSHKLNCPICSGKRVVTGLNDLATKHPELLARWDYEKNEASPSVVHPGSNSFFWWKCEKGHSFQTSPHLMIIARKGMNCPICRKRSVEKGVNDLETTHPWLAKEWDYSKNKLRPDEVTSGSAIKVFWVCGKGHSWKAPISTRAVRHTGCPFCGNKKLLIGFNDLGTLLPEAKELWDYEKNSTVPEDYVGRTTMKKAWFKCPDGHPSYLKAINAFARGQRCPICAGKKVMPGQNDLLTTHPQLCEEWDYEKNAFGPDSVSKGSDKKVWWICKDMGHSWQAPISSRAGGRGCPQCAKERQTSLAEKTFAFYLSKHFSDLEENAHPAFLGQRELDVYIPSLKLAIEYDGKGFHQKVQSDLKKDALCRDNGITLIRIREEGCPLYETSAILIECPENSGNISTLTEPVNRVFDIIAQKWDINIEHIDSVDADYGSIVEAYYTYRKENSLAVNCPELLKEWDYEANGNLKPDLISTGSDTKVAWKCKLGHRWKATVSSRVAGNGCPVCYGRIVLKGFNDLESQRPDVAKEWDYEKNAGVKPDEVYVYSQKEFWWNCGKGHPSWPAKVTVRTRMNTGCPYCKGRKAIPGENDLETMNPEIAKQWDYERNGDLKPSDFLPHSEKVVWWKCENGHPPFRRAIFLQVAAKHGCPAFANRLIIPGQNDLATLYPEIAKEWDYEKNGDLKPTEVGAGGGSHKEIWWKCQRGHSWRASLATRIRQHTGCPECAKLRRKKH